MGPGAAWRFSASTGLAQATTPTPSTPPTLPEPARKGIIRTAGFLPLHPKPFRARFQPSLLFPSIYPSFEPNLSPQDWRLFQEKFLGSDADEPPVGFSSRDASATSGATRLVQPRLRSNRLVLDSATAWRHDHQVPRENTPAWSCFIIYACHAFMFFMPPRFVFLIRQPQSRALFLTVHPNPAYFPHTFDTMRSDSVSLPHRP